MKKVVLSMILLVIMISLTTTRPVFSQTVLLYQNNFESPLISPSPNCGPDLDVTLINVIWGGTGLGTGGGGEFEQQYTVETILINGPDLQYIDSSGLGGDYCLSMLSVYEDDRAALTLNSQMLPFANISFLMSPIDVAGCGGPFGLDTAVMHISVYDTPGGIFSFSSPGTLLDQDTVSSGGPGLTSFTFNWTVCTTSLDIMNTSDGNITIVFDLIRSGYAAIDSIVISSSVLPSFVQENHVLGSIMAYPNPFSNELSIKGTSANGEIVMYDLTGVEISRQNTFARETVILTETLRQGSYLLMYNDRSKLEYLKLMKF